MKRPRKFHSIRSVNKAGIAKNSEKIPGVLGRVCTIGRRVAWSRSSVNRSYRALPSSRHGLGRQWLAPSHTPRGVADS